MIDSTMNNERPPDKTHPAYLAGYDAGVNGANMSNCNFALFGTQDTMTLWEAGQRDGTAARRKDEGR